MENKQGKTSEFSPLATTNSLETRFQAYSYKWKRKGRNEESALCIRCSLMYVMV